MCVCVCRDCDWRACLPFTFLSIFVWCFFFVFVVHCSGSHWQSATLNVCGCSRHHRRHSSNIHNNRRLTSHTTLFVHSFIHFMVAAVASIGVSSVMCDVFITALTKFYHKNFKFIVTIIGVMFTGCEPPQPQRTELEHNTIWNKSPEFNGKIHNSVLFISIAWCLIQQTKQKIIAAGLSCCGCSSFEYIYLYVTCYMLNIAYCGNFCRRRLTHNNKKTD